jgi:asparagine synthase (glutamine-hydrolysing)
MCGICGVVQVGDGPGREVVAPHVLDAMTDVMTHRGPDDRGTYSAPGVALGVRRLSIVDVAAGHQPVFSEDDSVVAVQNGELYNHGEVRSRLRADGHILRTRCDTEVLPHLYEQVGVRYPEELRGKFAIAVWDERRARAVVARDRMGVKPLYWAHVDDVVVFASELKSVLASGLVSPELDLEAIDLYLTLGFVPGPRTPLARVNKLAPGSVLVIGSDGVREQVYWEYPEPRPERASRSLQEYADELLSLLREAVRDRLMSDVPLGAMLSGGLDSSLIVALMADEAGRPIDTFSVGFREDPGSELGDARRVAERFGCVHHELELSMTETAVDVDELVWHLDEPVADLSALGFDLLSRLASEHVTVALAGQGADELFGGYTKHKVAASVRPVLGLPASVRRGIAALPWPGTRVQRGLDAVAAEDPSRRLLAMSGRLVDGARAELYGDGALSCVAAANALQAIERVRGGLDGDPLAVMLYLDARLALVDDMLLYFDKTSMAHSLEVRVPFLDHRLVEWAATLPSPVKVHRGLTKRVLREAGARFLSHETIGKKKVGFFRFALTSWLDTQLEGAAGERLRDPSAAYRDLLDPAAVGRLVDRYRASPSEDDARLVFAILLLEAWLSSYVARAKHPTVSP